MASIHWKNLFVFSVMVIYLHRRKKNARHRCNIFSCNVYTQCEISNTFDIRNMVELTFFSFSFSRDIQWLSLHYGKAEVKMCSWISPTYFFFNLLFPCIPQCGMIIAVTKTGRGIPSLGVKLNLQSLFNYFLSYFKEIVKYFCIRHKFEKQWERRKERSL